LETERESTVEIAACAANAAVQIAARVPWAAGKAATGLLTSDEVHLSDVNRTFGSILHEAYYRGCKISRYADIVAVVCARVTGAPLSETSQWRLAKQEQCIVAALPPDVERLTLHELIEQRHQVFPQNLQQLFQGRSYGMMIFFLKTIYHCSHLRRLRKEITLVTIAGEKNAGKTTLNKKIFGPDVVREKTGTGKHETTVFPTAYGCPDLPSTIFCDLPGSSDQDTALMSDLFFALGDVTVYLIRQRTAAAPHKGDTIRERVGNLLQVCRPCLICINLTDMLLRDSDPDNFAPDLQAECALWAKSDLFGTHLQGHEDLQAPKWDCERGTQAGAIIASIKSETSPLSVWMTSFEPRVKVEDSKRLLFGAEHVRAWVQEAVAELRLRVSE
jgi:hypothetical protein